MSISISQNDINNSNPCSDRIFLELKEKKINNMSNREYQYFMQMSNACLEYQETSLLVEKDKGINRIRKIIGYGVIVFCLYLVQFF